MNLYSMTLEERERFGVDARDFPDIWEQFSEFQQGGRKSDERDDQDTELMQEEYTIEQQRQSGMECWIMESQEFEELQVIREAAGRSTDRDR